MNFKFMFEVTLTHFYLQFFILVPVYIFGASVAYTGATASAKTLPNLAHVNAR